MKKYLVTVDYVTRHGFVIVARNEKSAINKTVKRCKRAYQDQTITGEIVVGVQYLGFYLGKVFVEANHG